MDNVLNDSQQYIELIKAKDDKIARLEAQVMFYEEQARLAKHRSPGVAIKKSPLPEQIGLFDDTENESRKDMGVEYETQETRRERVEEDILKQPVEYIELTIDDFLGIK